MRTKTVILIFAMLAAGVANVAAQRHGQGRPMGSVPGAMHSNAPARSRAASADRDKGNQRAADVGKGKKKGLAKTKHTNK
jgi:hypothetical protein